jgi:HD-GYP domain-containing protein (c-di-GMP phosphodiesterase class II)
VITPSLSEEGSQVQTSNDPSPYATPSTQDAPRASLKKFIRKRLIVRLCITGGLIAVCLAALIFFLETRRLGGVVNNRAAEMARNFNNDIQLLLDKINDPDALRNKLKMLLIAGNLNNSTGQLICAGIYDTGGKAIAVERDAECDYTGAFDDFMAPASDPLPNTSSSHRFRWVDATPHIQLTYPLLDSTGVEVGAVKGVFAVSSDASGEVIGRIVRTLLEVVGIVVVTTLILYPIIITLMGRLTQLADTLLEANIETLQALGSAIAKRDRDTDIHNYRVTIYSVALAEALNINRGSIRGLIKGAFLHDIGKIGVSDRILLKPDVLTKNEREAMKRHVNHGIDIIGGSDWLKDAKEVVEYHHEQYDGNGYPNGLKGDSIPVNARIFAIADVFDALTSIRPYKDSIDFDEAMKIMEESRGIHFDPLMLDMFGRIAPSLHEAYSKGSENTLQQKLEEITRHYFTEELYR